jgi:NTP pyrophosphatase (non-canonical NTP hydrolase)
MSTYTPPGAHYKPIDIPECLSYDQESVNRFWAGVHAIQELMWQVSDDHGFHAARKVDDPDHSIRDMSDITALMLIVTEIAEATESIRHGNPASDKIPAYSGAEEELADAFIRIMDLCQSRGWDLAGAVLTKTAYNERREHLHGKRV